MGEAVRSSGKEKRRNTQREDGRTRAERRGQTGREKGQIH